MWLFASTLAWMPTMAFIFSSATVVAGLFRSTFSRMPGGSTSASTLSPTLSAVVGIDALLDDLVQAQLVGPELFVTEGVEAKNALALGELSG